MKKILLTLAAMAMVWVAAAQRHQSFGLEKSHIEAFAADSSAYQAIVDRVNVWDGDVSMLDMALLYYGYTFTGGYNPGSGQLRELSFMETAYNYNDPVKALEAAGEFLSVNPAGVLGLTILLNIASMAEDWEAQEYYRERLDLIMDVIGYSGDGNAKSPYQVTDSSSEMVFLERVIGVSPSMVTGREWSDDTRTAVIDWTDQDGYDQCAFFARDLCAGN